MLFVINSIKLHLTGFKSVHCFLAFCDKKNRTNFSGNCSFWKPAPIEQICIFFYFVELKKWIEFYNKNILYMDMLHHSLSNPITNCNYVTLAQKSLRCELSCMPWILLV